MKTVLLVNDDTAGLIALALILRSHGYGVLESSDGDEAIHVCLEHRGPIDLLLMDFELGGSNDGPQLAERLLELSPEMQVLFMFSSPPNKLLEVGILPWGCVFLRKPFGPEALVRIVQESFGGVPSIPRKLAVGVEIADCDAMYIASSNQARRRLRRDPRHHQSLIGPRIQ